MQHKHGRHSCTGAWFLQLAERCNAPELAQQGVMGQKAYILGVIVCFVLALTFLLGFPWVNPFQDAQPPALQRDRFSVKVATKTAVTNRE